jgi:hypothetical protein
MKRIISLILCSCFFIGCVTFTPKERAAMCDYSVMNTMSDAELLAFETKIRKQQRLQQALFGSSQKIAEATLKGSQEQLENLRRFSSSQSSKETYYIYDDPYSSVPSGKIEKQ